MTGEAPVGAPVMSAYVLIDDDSDADFRDIPRPAPEPGEVLVRIAAASLNPHDAAVRSRAAARYMTYDYPVVLGSDFAGVVEEVGDGVSDLQPGERVFGLVRELVASRGSFAPYVAVPRGWLARTPSAVSDIDAGVLGLAALGALRCVDAVEPLSTGDIVLVNGATGGIGGYVLQLLAACGVNVIATARDGAEAEYVLGLGATETVNWTSADLGQVISRRYPAGIDALIDLVTTEKEALTRLVRTIVRVGGRVASTRHAVDSSALPDAAAQNLVIELDTDALEQVAKYAASGVLRAPLVTTFELSQVSEAFDLLGRVSHGKIALVSPSNP